jgi:hypothetical protein
LMITLQAPLKPECLTWSSLLREDSHMLPHNSSRGSWWDVRRKEECDTGAVNRVRGVGRGVKSRLLRLFAHATGLDFDSKFCFPDLPLVERPSRGMLRRTLGTTWAWTGQPIDSFSSLGPVWKWCGLPITSYLHAPKETLCTGLCH